MNHLTRFRDLLPVSQLVRLYDYWDAKRGGRRWPRRSDVDPLEMRFAIGNIDLIEITYGDHPDGIAPAPIVFRFRISGSNIDRDEGFNMQGKTLDEYPLPVHRENIRRTYLRILAEGNPDFEVLERLDEGQITRYARMLLPLSDDGSRVDMFLAGRYELKSDS